MAAVAEYASPPPFSRSSSLSVQRSPDTASPIYPERAIRPLPKSRLKSKLSPENQTSLVFPPEPPIPAINFDRKESDAGGGHHQKQRVTNGEVAHGQYLHHHPSQRQQRQDRSVAHEHCTCGEEVDSGDEEVEFDHPDYRYSTANGPNGKDPVLDNVQRRLNAVAPPPAKPPPPGSTASSADGYESFENTSNKKKRKIPLSTTSSMHQSQLSAEMASMGISGGAVDGAMDDGGEGGVVGVARHYTPPPGTVGAGTGISGAGRGRYGKQNGVRRPLASSNMNSINGYNARLPVRSGSEVKGAADAGIENTGGIISQAIKTAAEQGPLTPSDGQENASLLQSASSTPANARTQFTFAVESESATKMVDQQAAAHAAAAQGYGTPTVNSRQPAPVGNGGKGMSTQGTQTTPSPRQGQNGASGVNNTHRGAPGAPPNQLPPAQQPAPKPKPRRRPSKEYALAARQRRLQQEYTNYHHRPTKDNMWICEFCEYEDIFGVPPVALIRQYEIKDRAERKRQAEKRRLLEKAKAKGRKGKKGNKKGNANNANNLNNNAAMHQQGVGGGANNGQLHQYDPNMPPEVMGDEYYDDDEFGEGDEYEPMGPEEERMMEERYGGEYYPPPPPAVPGGMPHAKGGG